MEREVLFASENSGRYSVYLAMSVGAIPAAVAWADLPCLSRFAEHFMFVLPFCWTVPANPS